MKKKVTSLNTKYKIGEFLYCIKDVIWNEKILFHQGETYVVNDIEYSKSGGLKTTTYWPHYLVNQYSFYSPYEEFVVNKESHGGSGMSGYGNVDVHFKSISI
jgi:hypothetical protein